MKEVDKSPTDYIEFEKTSELAAGIALTVGGIAISAVGLGGIDANEASTPNEALASITFGEDEAFITTPDLGFGAALGFGLSITAIGLSKIFSRKTRRTR